MLKVVTLVGTRPELIKLSLVVAELDRYTDHVFVHSGQNYDVELSDVFLKDLGIRKPNHFLDASEDGAAKTIAGVIEKFDAVLGNENPDAVLVLGDTNSCLGVIAAKKRKIPVFHMEAGNRSFDERVPEEVNRRIVDHLSDINLVYTEHARRHLLDEGIASNTIFKTGSPMREILDKFSEQIETSGVLATLKLTSGNYFVVSAHREENVDDAQRLNLLMQSLGELAKKYKKPIVFSTHPRTRARCEEFGVDEPAGVQFVKPMGFFDYVHLQQNAFCVLSDSGTLTEEASILKFPAVMIRDAHERPEGVDEGSTIMTGLRSDRVLDGVAVATDQDATRFRVPADYEVTNVSGKVVRIILSYTDFVRRTVWHQH